MQDSYWLKRLETHRAIAVIRAPNFHVGVQMAMAVAAGGMRLIELTWNGNEVPEIISELRSKLPDCAIGTGTILTAKELIHAVNSGAQFVFSPNTNIPLIRVAKEAETPVIPGALSPTEIIAAWQAGASCVKVFPISAVGGTSYIKSLRGPLGQIPLIPTGGVTLDNALDFIRSGAIAVGLSGDLFPKDAIAAGNWEAIAARSRQLTQALAKWENGEI
ncbi:MAG: bifunctional 4-hydroxy-2-oxoglutarate aldolase/2-dehydro-3-deoxy-phosphogluconate aldolase [Limnospira sp.]